MFLTRLINANHSAYADGLADLVTLPFVWLPLALMLVYLIIRGSTSMINILRITLLLLVCVLFSHVLGYVFDSCVYGDEGTIGWALRNGITQTQGARQYGVYSLLTTNAMSVAVFVSLLVRYRRLTLTLLFWAVLNAWASVYMGADSAGFELLSLATGGILGIAAWGGYKILSRADHATTPQKANALRTATGYPTADCRLVVCAAATLFLIITFLPVI